MPDVIWADGYGFTTPNNPAQTTLNSVVNLALTQLIDQPTRYRDGQNPTALDLVFTNSPNTVMSIKYLPAIGSSDHNCVIFSVLVSTRPTNMKKRSYTDYDKIREHLSEVDWQSLNVSDNVDDSWFKFKSCFLAVEKQFTSITYTEKTRTLPFLTKEVREGIKSKNKAWKKYKKSKRENHLADFKKCCNKSRNLTRKIIIDYKVNIALSAKTNPKKFWKNVSSSNPNRRRICQLIRSDATVLDSPTDIANCLNAVFATNFSHSVLVSPPPPFPKRNHVHEMPSVVIDADDVLKRLNKLDPNKAWGPDGIHPRLLKEASALVAMPLADIFKMSLKMMMVPADWKSANIVSIFKRGDKNNPENNRPISLTSAISKLLDSIFNDAIINHLEKKWFIVEISTWFQKESFH
ncbi:uncharacterized protein LOC136025788 [Artemia franciscana]|uniref:uncharacterized protein LOC136025788 n=1 Tax=Artemia franciscana TaxID=6661 RepID=UPI0032DA227B